MLLKILKRDGEKKILLPDTLNWVIFDPIVFMISVKKNVMPCHSSECFETIEPFKLNTWYKMFDIKVVMKLKLKL